MMMFNLQKLYDIGKIIMNGE